MARSKHKSAPGVAPVPHHTAEGVEPRSATARALDTATWIVIVAGVILIPLWVSPTGEDAFRYPKELLFRGEAILLTAILALYLILVPREFPLRGIPRSLWLLVGAIVGWTGATTLTSTNVELSIRSFLWVVACAVGFLCTYAQLRTRSRQTIWLAIVPALINALIGITQAHDVWRPIEATYSQERMAVIGLMGNPNDLGALLVVPAIAAAALCISKGQRFFAVIAAILLPVGIIATVTQTAIVAYLVGLAALVVRTRLRTALIVLLIVTATASGLLSINGPVKARVQNAFDLFAGERYEELSSHRLGSSLVALEMVREHPLTGTGPGTYGWNFFDYRLSVTRTYADLLGTDDPRRRVTDNFGEAHNDHLEIASESGVAGYALFIIAFAWLLSIHLPLNSDPFFARLSIAVVAGFVVTCIGLFPLQLAGASHSILFFAAFIAAAPSTAS